MKKITLEDIFADDQDGLLTIRPKNHSSKTDEDRLVESFLEINRFITDNKREPTIGSSNLKEHTLASRLKGIREDEEKVKTLIDLDEHQLLKINIREINSVEDILNDDDIGLLENDDANIHKIQHIPKITNMPDYVARRKPCKEFYKYEELFIQCQKDMKSKKNSIRPFSNEQQINVGEFFILKGVLLYVDKVGKKTEEKGKLNARLRCIFENGTESDMLLRSLSAELYKDGRRVIQGQSSLLEDNEGINNEDKKTGYLYILKSEAQNGELSSINNLFKIGYSESGVPERIKNSENESTYLMSKVEIVKIYKCYNLNPQKLEHLLHTFFGDARLLVDIYDKSGKRYTPREWFIAPLEVIDQALKMVISGDILNYTYDSNSESIVSLD